jgi:hypothetical protein
MAVISGKDKNTTFDQQNHECKKNPEDMGHNLSAWVHWVYVCNKQEIESQSMEECSEEEPARPAFIKIRAASKSISHKRARVIL